MAELNLLVRLKTPDTVAVSARLALRELMGHAELAALEREELWRFRGDFEPAELTEELLEGSSRFVNPAKHTWRRVASLTGLEPPARRAGKAHGALVRKLDDFRGRDARAYCRNNLGLTGVEGVEYAVLWTLWLEGSAGGENLAALVDCRARDAGLLANPHCESWEPVVFETSR
ncbi:MAG: hypothetical protein GF399_12300 [Candidatus Coatesbacteria bacterium]|nr:hypothetical protein [Candidatus Coatesbacteria bacterium]